jgi:hypothetical protein
MIRRLFAVEPALIATVAGLVYGAAAMLYRAYVAHDGVLDMDLLVAALTAVWGLWTRMKVTPLARPRLPPPPNDQTDRSGYRR